MLTLLSYLARGVGQMQYSCGHRDLTFVRLKLHQSMHFHSAECKIPVLKSKCISASCDDHCQICSCGEWEFNPCSQIKGVFSHFLGSYRDSCILAIYTGSNRSSHPAQVIIKRQFIFIAFSLKF